MRRSHAVATVVTLSLGTAFGAGTSLAQVTAYEGARIIVGDGRAAMENATLVVDGARIVQVGTAATVRVPAGAARVNLAGKTVMPAIINTHEHLSQTREALTLDLKRRAYFGVSASMSLGQDVGEVLGMRGAPMPGAARYFSAGRGITMPEPGRTQAPYWINNAAEGRQAVQELAAKQVDIVKIWVDDRNDMFKKITPEISSAIINEAHARGLRVTAHIFEREDAKALLRAGIDSFAHGIRDVDVDDETITLFRQHPNIVLVPNLPDPGKRTDLAWLRGHIPVAEMTALEAENTDRPQAQAAFGIQSRNLGRLNAAGVRIALGTDGNTAWAPHTEMVDMVASGMTPMQVIVAATRNGAEFLRMTDAGTLEVGKSADFLVLDANPLDDITNTRRIAASYLRGAAVDRSQPPR